MQKISESKKCRKVGPYILLRPIGKGSYSTVFEAVSGNRTFAVKQISLQNLPQKNLERIHQELDALRVIRHPNIVQLVDFKQTSRNLYLVFEHCKKTDLHEFIKQHYGGKLPQDQVRRILTQLKAAFQVLRQHRVVHRDLKLQNILVTETFEVKLADFGFAKFLEHNEFLTSWVGSPTTMAPEVVGRLKYNEKCDMWSLGVITYQMLFGTHPFFTKDRYSRSEMVELLKKPVAFPCEVHSHLKDLIGKMLVCDPEKRLEFETFFRDAWLQEDSISLAQLLRDEVLKSELSRSLVSSAKPSLQKQFILQNCQMILNYSLVEFYRNYVENSLTSWVNLAKHILESRHRNAKLTFLALALLMENIDRTVGDDRVLLLNASTTLEVPRFMQFREIQSWPMSQYTKRLPGFLAKSRATINQHLKGVGRVGFQTEQGNKSLSALYLKQLQSEVPPQKSNEQNELRLFLKIRSCQGSNLSINVTSSVLSNHALAMLVQKSSLKIHYHELCKKCSSLFRLVVVNEPTELDLQMQEIRSRIESLGEQ